MRETVVANKLQLVLRPLNNERLNSTSFNIFSSTKKLGSLLKSKYMVGL